MFLLWRFKLGPELIAFEFERIGFKGGGCPQHNLYGRVGRGCHVEGMSIREAARVFGLHRETVSKMLRYSAPPGYRHSRPVRRLKLDVFTGIIDRLLKEDGSAPRKQRHTAKRRFERLRSREVFVPLAHNPGHAQLDFGEALVVIAGSARKAHFLAMDLPHSDA